MCTNALSADSIFTARHGAVLLSTVHGVDADWSGNMKIYDSVLKPCPFCGNKTSVHAYTYKDAVYRQYAVKCNKCGARIMGASTELAIEKWNRRAEPEVKTQYIAVELDGLKSKTVG